MHTASTGGQRTARALSLHSFLAAVTGAAAAAAAAAAPSPVTLNAHTCAHRPAATVFENLGLKVVGLKVLSL